MAKESERINKDVEEAENIARSIYEMGRDEDFSDGLARLIRDIAQALANREKQVKEDCAEIAELEGEKFPQVTMEQKACRGTAWKIAEAIRKSDQNKGETMSNRFNSLAPIPPENLPKGFAEKHFGPLPKCKHGMISAICITCNPEVLQSGTWVK